MLKARAFLLWALLATAAPATPVVPGDPLTSAARTRAEAIDPVKDAAASEAAWRVVLAEAERDKLPLDEQALILNKVTDAIYYQQRAAEAVPMLETMAKRLTEAGLGSTAAMADTLSNLGTISAAAGDSGHNIEYQRRALAVREKLFGPDDPRLADTLLNLAAALYDDGQAFTAAPYAERAVAAYRKGGTRDATTAIALGTAANIAVDGGHPRTAISLAEQAVEIANDVLPHDNPYYGFAQVTLGKALMQNGRFEEAEGPMRAGLDVFSAVLGPKHRYTRAAMHNLGYVENGLGNLEGALTLTETAAQGSEEKDPREASKGFASAANYAGELGRADKALALAERAYTVAKRLPETDDARPSAARTLSLHLESSGGLPRALEMARYAADHDALLRPDESGRNATADLHLGVIEIESGDRTGGWARVQAAAGVLQERVTLLAARTDVGEDLSTFYESFNRATEAAILVGDLDAALRYVQLANWGLNARAVQQVAIRRGSDRDPRVAELVRTIQDDYRQLRQLNREHTSEIAGDKSTTAADTQKAIDALTLRIADGEAKIAAAIPGYTAANRPAIVTLAALQKRLGRDEQVLIALPGRAVIPLIAITAKAAAGDRAIVGRAALRSTVAALRRSVDSGLAGTTAGYDFDSARQVHDWLFTRRIAATLGRRGTLHIVTADALATFSFAMLVADLPAGTTDAERLANAHWLVDDYATDIPVSLDSIGRADPVTRTAGGFAGIGAPELDGAATAKPIDVAGLFRGGPPDRGAILSLPSLPGARGELFAIADAVAPRNRLMLLGADATEARVKRADLSHRSVIAFATHGLIAGEVGSQIEPALVMTPEAAGAAASDDGLLTATEIASMRLDSDLVILSACNTAAGRSRVAAPYTGLANAFLYAGARALLLSHWQVRDDAAARLSVGTVRNAAKGMTRAAALRRAQRDLMNDPGVPNARHPAIWAPFILVGE